MNTLQTRENDEIEMRKDFIPLSSLSWEEASKDLNFPEPNLDDYLKRLQEHKLLKDREGEN